MRQQNLGHRLHFAALASWGESKLTGDPAPKRVSGSFYTIGFFTLYYNLLLLFHFQRIVRIA